MQAKSVISQNGQTQQKSKLEAGPAEKKKIGGSTMMFVNNCVGDVILTIACRFGQLGLPLGVFLLTTAFLYEVWAFRVIGKACAFSDAGDLLDLMKKCYNKKIAMFIDVCAVLMLFAVQICYTIIISSYIHQAYDLITKTPMCVEDVVCEEHFKKVETIIRLIIGFTILPFEDLITSVNVLNFISSFAVIFVSITLVCIIGRSTQTLITGKLAFDDIFVPRQPVMPYKPNFFDIFIDFTGMFAMFSLQPVIPPLYEELVGSREIKKYILGKASDIASFVLYLMYMITAIMGCLVFYGENQPHYRNDNILVNYASADVLMSIIRIMYVLVVMIGYPVVIYQIRASMASWFGIDRKTTCSKVTFVSMGLIATFICSTVAMFTPSILVIFDPFCAVFGCVLFQIMPLMVWYKLPKLEKESEPEQDCGYDLDKRVARQSIISIAVNMVGGGRRSIKGVNRQLSASFIANARPSLIAAQIGIEDSHDSDVLVGDEKGKAQTDAAAEAKMWKRRKMIFYPALIGTILFNTVSFGVSLYHIAHGEEE
ncbi:Amino_acid transporter family [Hexamita inflata]|uniref:Amino acid transporter family n=1 Tax=Hexamita inflata TaxID=28002 RepID=A0AA86UW90_9EUKA|nr:Amino acid transporter family [Hexamita inflata]CAI9970449.1 Amino acid transporter family [Hexamita inflata]